MRLSTSRSGRRRNITLRERKYAAPSYTVLTARSPGDCLLVIIFFGREEPFGKRRRHAGGASGIHPPVGSGSIESDRGGRADRGRSHAPGRPVHGTLDGLS